MNSPFKYGKIVTGKSFINRTEDIKRIRNNIAAGINTVLISPRRWGVIINKTAIRTAKKRQFVDPSIATAVLRTNEKGILRDFETFGFLFESVCT